MILPVTKKNAGVIYLPQEVAQYGRRIYGQLKAPVEIKTLPAHAVFPGQELAAKAFPTAGAATADTQGAAEADADRAFTETIKTMAEEPQLQIRTDSLQRTAVVRVLSSGRRIADRMQELIDSFGGEPGWTIQIAISTSSPLVFYEYNQLRRLAFFFTGLKPLCGKEEQIYMQWLGDVHLYMEDYAFSVESNETEAYSQASMIVLNC